jgi:hypothetical protein
MTRFRLAALALPLAAVAITLLFASLGGHVLGAGTHTAASSGCDADFPDCASSGSKALDEPAEGAKADSYWSDRVTYPTGKYNPLWLRNAASEAKQVPNAVPAGHVAKFKPIRMNGKLAPITSTFIALGPAPEKMSGCSGCFDYGTTEGRINDIVVDPTTTTNGSIVAYAASDGGGVWKTTNCCATASTTWAPTTDDPLIADVSIDSLTIDPNNHNTIYAGTGDLNYGSFSMGSQGILKSTDAGAHWTVLGANVFGPALNTSPTVAAGNFPQYDSVGKVRVDPNNSNIIAAGTKTGVWLSYDAGANWTGPCQTNSFNTQRQDITGLELSDMGLGQTRIFAAVGVRGFASPVQNNLNLNGANGLYKATMPASGCPTFTSIASDANGFVFGTAVTGSPYATGAPMRAGSGTAICNANNLGVCSPAAAASSGDQLGRIDIAVAPSNPNVMYAQVGSILPNSGTNCGNAAGCQLGAWSSTDGGATWSFMAGSAGGSLRGCNSSGGSNSTTSYDYPQNWYDQGVEVDPNNPDRVFFQTFEVWMATRTGNTWYNTSCAYTQTALGVHADEHAMAFVPGSSAKLLIGNDGGVMGTLNADAAVLNTTRPTWFNLDGVVSAGVPAGSGFNTIEYYNGDIWSGNATDPFFGPYTSGNTPWAVGGAQDNMDSTVHFTGSPTGPVQWQGNVGGDGFWTAIDGKGGYIYASNNSGALHRCTNATNNCANTGAVYGGSISATPMNTGASGDGSRTSFVTPYDLFRGNIGGTGNAECGTRCNHMIVGTYRIWENTTVDTTSFGSIANAVRTPDLTKASLGGRSYINQLHYAPQNQTLAIAATNDGNVQVVYGLGGANGSTAPNVNLTNGNAVLPNRPILDARLDPGVQNTLANPFMGYAAVGGFNANTPSTPGHVFRFVCSTVNCTSFTWQDKTGNLPDIPVDSIYPNFNYPQQVFAGTDFGLYFTNDITAASPTWYHFQNGLPSVMIWTMQDDRAHSALSVWTRSRGAYAWPLPTGAIKQAQTITFGTLTDKTYGDADFALTGTSDSGLTVTYTTTGGCTAAGSTAHITSGGSCTITAHQAGNIDYNAASDVSQTFNIAKANQAITFPAIGNHAYGDADFPAGASASSGLAISYATTGPCSVTGSTVHITGIGDCQVTASQPGNASYNAASDSSQTFSISKGGQTIAFTTVDHNYGDSDFQITATATSGLTVSLTRVSGNCTLDSSTSPATVHLGHVGSCTITASQAGDSNWNAADDVTRTFSINKASQTISFAALSNKTYGDSAFTLSASASSGLDVSFTTQDDCYLGSDGVTLHLTNAGTCTVTASQPGNDDYNAASDVSRTFTIAKADQTIDFASLADKTYGDADFGVSATASTGLPVSFGVSGQCSLINGQVHLTGAGSCTVTASQAGNGNYNAAPDISRTFSIAKTDQTIDFAALSDKTYGDADFDVSATATSGLAVTFSASGNCQMVFGKVDLTGAGTCTVTASQAGDSNYNAASDVSRTFSIAKSGQTISFATISDTTQHSADIEINATATSGLTVPLQATGPCTLSSNTSPASAHITGAGTCTITASQGGDSNYNAASDVVRSFSISKDDQTITFATPADRTYGDADFDPGATASSGLAVSYVATGDCSIVNGMVHITAAGSCTVTASQTGDANNNPASDVQRTFAIATAPLTITANDRTKTYGTIITIGTSQFTTSALVGSESVASVTLTSSGSGSAAHAGAYPIVPSAAVAGAGTDLANYSITYVNGTLTVNKASQAIDPSFSSAGSHKYGDADFAPGATASSGLAVAYSASGACSIVNGKVHIGGAGACTVTATQSGNSDYEAASPVDQHFTAGTASLTITPNLKQKIVKLYTGLDGTEFTTSGLVGSDSVSSVTMSSSGAAANAAAGDYPLVASAAVAGAGTDLSNYTVHYAPGTLRVLDAGLVGLNGVSIKTNGGTIDTAGGIILSNGGLSLSSVTLTGSVLSTQGSVSLASSAKVTGNVTAGTTISNLGHVNGSVVPGALSPAVTAPSVAACGKPYSPKSSITGSDFAYSAATGDLEVIKGTVTLTSGTYCFHSVILGTNTRLRVTGPVTVNLTGTWSSTTAKIANASHVPDNLHINSSFAGSKGISIAGSADAYMTILAPSTTVKITKGAFFGSVVAGSVKVINAAALHLLTH